MAGLAIIRDYFRCNIHVGGVCLYLPLTFRDCFGVTGEDVPDEGSFGSLLGVRLGTHVGYHRSLLSVWLEVFDC